MSHTPGPWNRDWISGALRHICKNVDYDCFMLDELPEDANIPSYYNNGDVSLIVAAPDLLEACKEAVRLLEDPQNYGGDCRPCYGMLRVAIHKAEGNHAQ